MAKGKFGGEGYKPLGLGPNPDLEPANDGGLHHSADSARSEPDNRESELKKLLRMKVPFSSRITVSAEKQLKVLAQRGHKQTDLLAEALNLLFRKHGLDERA